MLRPLFIFGMAALAAPQGWSQAQIQAIVNSASFQPGVTEPTTGIVPQVIQGLPSGGALATAFVSGIAGYGIVPGNYVAPASSPLPRELGGVSVGVNGAFAPILSVYIPPQGSAAYAQINFQMPLERNSITQGSPACVYCPGPTYVSVAGATGTAGVAGASATFPAGLRGMGAFFSDANGYAIALHASDNSPVTTTNPAHPGETIIAFADDFFDVWPPPPIGIPVPAQSSFTYFFDSDAVFFAAAAQAPTPAVVGGQYAAGGLFLQDYPTLTLVSSGPYGSFTNSPALQITYEGLAVGRIGVEEIHFVIPQNQAPGNWALFFNTLSCTNFGGKSCTNSGPSVSSAYVTLPVQ